MSPTVSLALLAVLVLASTAAGFVQRASTGRIRAGSGRITAAELGTTAAFGRRATLVQFSTPACAACPGTARLLAGLAAEHPGVVHLEVDLARHPDVADRFGVLQTPTTLLVDAGRSVRARIGGAPRREALEHELRTVLGGDRAR